ncbi:hypothetical protein UPYG_G00198020 [Umbra pygmaea]|uniref:Uncharacterized protein n=1 Tax=Umbra pygmaea TaxID=75934 RepID=A0ABD0X5G2_UMBPY
MRTFLIDIKGFVHGDKCRNNESGSFRNIVEGKRLLFIGTSPLTPVSTAKRWRASRRKSCSPTQTDVKTGLFFQRDYSFGK